MTITAPVPADTHVGTLVVDPYVPAAQILTDRLHIEGIVGCFAIPHPVHGPRTPQLVIHTHRQGRLVVTLPPGEEKRIVHVHQAADGQLSLELLDAA